MIDWSEQDSIKAEFHYLLEFLRCRNCHRLLSGEQLGMKHFFHLIFTACCPECGTNQWHRVSAKDIDLPPNYPTCG